MKPPFNGNTIFELANNIIKGEYIQLPIHYSNEINKCIKCLLNITYNKRPSIYHLLQNVKKQYLLTNIKEKLPQIIINKEIIIENTENIEKLEKIEKLNINLMNDTIIMNDSNSNNNMNEQNSQKSIDNNNNNLQNKVSKVILNDKTEEIRKIALKSASELIKSEKAHKKIYENHSMPAIIQSNESNNNNNKIETNKNEQIIEAKSQIEVQVELEVDRNKLQLLIKKEQMKLRRLLQSKEYFQSNNNIITNNFIENLNENNNVNQNQQQNEIITINDKIKISQNNLLILEKSFENGKISQINGLKYVYLFNFT